jgi:TonB family protein
VPMGFLATTGGTTGGAAAFSVVAHAALVVAAVVGLHGAHATTSGAPANVDAVMIDAPEVVAEAPRLPKIVDSPLEHAAATSRVHEARLEQRAAGASTHEAPAATSVVTASNAPTAHFSMTVNAVEPTAATVTKLAAPREVPAAAPAMASGSARARVTYRVDPKYTDEALSAGIEGDVGLEIVVSETGAFVSARVTRRLGYGLDEAALAAVAKWRFEPYRDVDGRVAAVRMPWPVRFRLQ